MPNPIESWDEQLRHADGKRSKFMDHQTEERGKPLVPYEWVIDGDVTRKPWWENVRADAIPLKPHTGLFGFTSPTGKKAERELRLAEQVLGGKAVMLMVPNDDSPEGWATRPVRIADLSKTARELDKEMGKALVEQKDDLMGSLRVAYMAVTGETDTK